MRPLHKQTGERTVAGSPHLTNSPLEDNERAPLRRHRRGSVFDASGACPHPSPLPQAGGRLQLPGGQDRSTMPSMTTLLLAGATGLVGQAVLRRALDDARVTRVVAPTRRALPAAPKLDNPLVDFDRLPADAPWWAVDAVICTLGTTIRDAGSPQAFRVVDHDYPLAVARLARQHGASTFALTSAMGADPASRIFYNRTKGELERDLAACGLRR
jgi:hypothetical protein